MIFLELLRGVAPVMFTLLACGGRRELLHHALLEDNVSESDAAAKGDAAREQLTAVDPQPPPQRALTDSWVLKGAVAAFLVAVALSMLRRLGRRKCVPLIMPRVWST